MKQIRTTKAVMTDASRPTETSLILFHNFNSHMRTDRQDHVIKFRSSKIIAGTDAIIGEGTAENPDTPAVPETYEYLADHMKIVGDAGVKNPITIEELSAIVDSLTLTETIYTLQQIEILLESAKIVIGNEQYYGLVSTDLEIE